MYVFPVLLPTFSNREDFLLTVSIFDDDTGDAVNLSGTNLAVNGESFTASSWTVTDGSIVTASTTQITIPTYPIGNQLLALSLTVGTGLDIDAGDPVTIADSTGKNTMMGYVTSYASSTGALVCQIGCAFEFEIRSSPHHHGGSGYTPWYDVSTVYHGGPLISAQLGNGISIIDQGFIQINIPASIMQKLRHKSFLASLNMTDSVNTRQVFVGELPIQFGGVMRGSVPNQNSSWNPNIF